MADRCCRRPFSVVLGLAWSGFWYIASKKAQDTMNGWRGREADAGRIYGCADATFGGFPFRIEVACEDPGVDDRPGHLSIRARHLAAVAQVWDPTLVIGEISGPLTLAPLGGSPTAAIDWMLAQASLRGTPGAPERLSIVVDQPNLSSVPASEAGPLVKAEHAELHARFAEQSASGHPALDLALSFAGLTAPALGPALGAPLGGIAAATTDASIVGVLHEAPGLSPKPLAQRLREFQAADGRLEIASARFQQGDLIVTSTGALALTPRGTLTGELQLTIVNFARLIPLLGIDRALAQMVPQDMVNRFAPGLDRLVPGLGNILRGGNGSGGAGAAGAGSGGGGGSITNANASAAALGAAALGGRQTEFEGQRAVALVLRIDDGMVLLGPLKLGQIPPL